MIHMTTQTATIDGNTLCGNEGRVYCELVGRDTVPMLKLLVCFGEPTDALFAEKAVSIPLSLEHPFKAPDMAFEITQPRRWFFGQRWKITAKFFRRERGVFHLTIWSEKKRLFKRKGRENGGIFYARIPDDTFGCLVKAA